MRPLALLLLAAASCSAVRSAPPPTERKPGPPVLDARKGWGSLPLKGAAAPTGIADLEAQLRGAYEERLELAEGADPLGRTVRVRGAALDDLESIEVDASGASVRPDFVPKPVGARAKPELSIRVARLDYRADPLLLDGARVRLFLSADGADLSLERAPDGRASLVLLGARSGRASFEVEDPRAFLEHSMRRRGRLFGASVKGVDLDLASAHPGHLAWRAAIEGRWLFLPVHLRFEGRMEVDAQQRALFDDLLVDGDDLGGDLATAFLGRRIRKLSEGIHPLLLFRDRSTVVTGFRCDLSRGLRMEVEFGRAAAPPPPP